MMKNLLFILVAFLVFDPMANAQVQKDSIFVFQPGPSDGKDAFIDSSVIYGYSTTNYGNQPEFCAIAWTRLGDPLTVRSLISFDLGLIPKGFTVLTAKLSLYANPNSPDGPHSSLTGLNKTVIRRITSDWEELVVTWDTQPTTTTLHQIFLPATVNDHQNFLDIDVTQLINDIISQPNAGYGLMLRLVDEEYYRMVMFASSDHLNPNLHPKLVIKARNPNYIPPVYMMPICDALEHLNFYPNPADENLNLVITDLSQDVDLEIYDLEGRKIRKQIINTETSKLDVSHLAQGVYVLNMRTDGCNVIRKKIVVNR